MNTRSVEPRDLEYWSANGVPQKVTFGPPAGHEDDVASCEAVVTIDDDGTMVVRVPWTLDEIELAHLAHGGTVWLSTWSLLPPHMLEVSAP